MNSTDIEFEIKGKIHIAPINQHLVLGHLQTIMKEFAELERAGNIKDEVTFNLTLEFKPIGRSDNED